MIKRYACHRLYITPNNYLKQAVVTLDEKGRVCHYTNLEEEIHSTEWIGGVIILSGIHITALSKDFLKWLEENIQPDEPIYAWHISHYNFEKEELTNQSILKRL